MSTSNASSFVCALISYTAAIATPAASLGSAISPGDLITSLGVLDRETGALIHAQVADEADARGNLYWLETDAVKRLDPASGQVDTFQLPVKSFVLPDDYPLIALTHVEIAAHPTNGRILVLADWSGEQTMEILEIDTNDGTIDLFSHYRLPSVYGQAGHIALDAPRSIAYGASRAYDDGAGKSVVVPLFQGGYGAGSLLNCLAPCELDELVVDPEGGVFALIHENRIGGIAVVRSLANSDLWTGEAYDIAIDIDGNILIATPSGIISLDLQSGETSVLLSGVSVAELSVVPVPEPSASALIALGLGAIGIAHRRCGVSDGR